MSFRLNPRHELSAEFRRVALEELDTAIRRLNAGDIHQTRTGLKRLRALLDLLRHADGNEIARGQKKRLRDAGRALSEARDTEVCLSTLDDMEADLHFGKSAPRVMLRNARKALIVEQGLAPGNRALALRRLRSVRRALAQWAPCVDWKAVRRALQRSYRRTRRACKEACKSQTEKTACSLDGLRAPDEMHALRKRLKMLWAQLRLVRACRPHLIRRWVGDAEKLTDLLGREHDLVILQNRLSRARGEDSFGRLHDAIDNQRAHLDSQALKLAEPCLSERPRAFIGRVFHARKSKTFGSDHKK